MAPHFKPRVPPQPHTIGHSSISLHPGGVPSWTAFPSTAGDLVEGDVALAVIVIHSYLFRGGMGWPTRHRCSLSS